MYSRRRRIYDLWVVVNLVTRSSILCSFCQHHKIIRMYQRPQFWEVPTSRRWRSSTEAATNDSITVATAVKNQEAGCQYQYNVGIGIGSGWYRIQATTPLWAHPHWKDGRYGIECGNGEYISRRLWSQGLFLIPTIFTKQTNASGRKANISSIRYNWKDLVTKSVRNYNRHRVPYEINHGQTWLWRLQLGQFGMVLDCLERTIWIVTLSTRTAFALSRSDRTSLVSLQS